MSMEGFASVAAGPGTQHKLVICFSRQYRRCRTYVQGQLVCEPAETVLASRCVESGQAVGSRTLDASCLGVPASASRTLCTALRSGTVSEPKKNG